MNESGDEDQNQDTATLEHKYHALDIRRAIDKTVLMCCQECNERKGREDYDRIWDDYGPIEDNLDIIKLLRYDHHGNRRVKVPFIKARYVLYGSASIFHGLDAVRQVLQLLKRKIWLSKEVK